MTAWALAFQIPNLFRRLLGEGALGTALVPIMTYTLEHEGKTSARGNLSSILAVLGSLLALICVIIAGVSICITPFLNVLRVKLTFQIMPLLIPYTFFICLAGVLAAVLNSTGKFFLPALSGIALNISLILCLVFVIPIFKTDSQAMLYSLTVAVLIAGLLQLLLMIFLLYKADMFPLLQINRAVLFSNPVIKEVWRLTLPGLIGASVLQVSLLIDRWMACWLGSFAVPALYYSDRLVYLSVGVFAVAMGTVILPGLSRHAAQNDINGMISTLSYGLRQILFICIPITFFTIYFCIPIVRLIFMRGAFDERALAETVWALQFYALGIPAFAAVKVLVAGFHSRKDMKTPVRIAVGCILLNATLNLILMWPLSQGGIALATTISSFVNCSLLLFLLRKSLGRLDLRKVIPSLLKIIIAAVIALLSATYVYGYIENIQLLNYLPPDFLPLLIAGSFFVFSYLLCLYLLRSEESSEWLRIFSVRFNAEI